ncbi:hypothetical protein EJ05DRAFT_473767 [Pseudovirgaria hyperparasitica]|uniref:DUF7582 domain-containing protein n=1 Tax=Pseudovirgaria hyperparasitica TaxID=470096 RepID=A0A6A6WHV2_9PEZI|nr:uncharacterized protein EJ05DRAFT_473767 [Pseudovirgaria hyperparasitica]KAF2761227.1 hypothetical protein EJ05DRAFT_473767 [Pseudovirgaria hyperparasitica]
MGCNVSVPNRAPSPSQLLELAPVAHPGQQSLAPELNRDTLVRALENVAAYLKSKGISITVIAVGGAVNTIFCRTRGTTHDIDFFNSILKDKEFKAIIEASSYARSKDRQLQSDWFNNRTVLFVPRSQRDALTRRAIAQNEVVFQAKGLTVLAAPWDYAIAAKLNRLTGSSGSGKPSKPYDMSDAATYLERYLRSKRAKGITKSQIKAWARLYETHCSDQVIAQLDAEYQKQYKLKVIDMSR